MAYSDKRRKRSRGSRWSQDEQDAHYRGLSKQEYDRVVGSGDPVKFLDDMGDREFLRVCNYTTNISRFGKTDWERICGMLGEGDERRMHQRAKDSRTNQNQEIQDRWDRQEAERNATLKAEVAAYQRQAELTAGLIGSDVHAAVSRVEAHDRMEGDWLEDPVAAYMGHGGFGEEVREQSGIKLQITVSLDCSTSMWENRLQKPAIKAFINLVMAMRELRDQYPTSVYTASFLWAGQEAGKKCWHVENMNDYSSLPEECRLDDGLERVRSEAGSIAPYWAGEDTWIWPLFQRIEQWESTESDPGAVRLDLIITDGVLEHPTDIRQASEIQEHRDGTLHTVLLNFLPEETWHDTQLPLRCIQYPAEVDNLDGLLRLMLAEYVGVYA